MYKTSPCTQCGSQVVHTHDNKRVENNASEIFCPKCENWVKITLENVVYDERDLKFRTSLQREIN